MLWALGLAGALELGNLLENIFHTFMQLGSKNLEARSLSPLIIRQF
jgi:hypothetical protein